MIDKLKIPDEYIFNISDTLRIKIFQMGMYRCPPENRPYHIYLTGKVNDYKIHVKLGDFYLQSVDDEYPYQTMFKKQFFKAVSKNDLFEQLAHRARGQTLPSYNPYEEMY